MQKLMLRRRPGESVGFVPTMGALHEGHLSLIRRARAENDCVVVSIFVNPAQFGPREDLKKYPRPFADDARACRTAGVDYLFAPAADDMYPDGYATFIDVGGVSEGLCGAARPGHFRGVATVVAKLFNIVRPDRAYFGLKDYQQLAVIRRMASDLNMPVKIVPCPIVRERSGLALSSRNRYLSPGVRDASAGISRALLHCRDLVVSKNVCSAAAIRAAAARMLRSLPSAAVEYVALVDPLTLAPVRTICAPVVLLCAVRMGTTRLIYNIVIHPPRRRPCPARHSS